MMDRTFSLMMTSAVVLSSMMVGCSGATERPRIAANDTHSLAPRVERLLADKDYAEALSASEKLVALDPQNGDARALLGRAYLANGRYLSARTAFNDALTLGNADPRTIVSLALTESGLGNLESARALLASHIGDLPAADYGLAMAMAGDPREGVRALLEANNAPEATAKTRQNLAYALAMAGAWGQARLVAGQDLSARDAEERMGEWTVALSQTSPSQRVVAMLGVSPRADDAGLPVQLALNANPAAPAALASADAAPAEVAPQQVAVADAAPAPVAQPAFAPEALAAVLAKAPVAPQAVASSLEPVEIPEANAAPAATPAAMPAIQREPSAAPDALKVAFAQPAPAPKALPAAAPVAKAAPASVKAAFAQPAPVVAPAAKPAHRAAWTAGLGAPASDGKASDWVIQLGAFDSDALARGQWRRLTASSDALKYYQAVHSRVQLNGRTFHRLAIRGFENRGAAWSACGQLKSAGQDCFVRLDDSAGRQASAERASGRTRASR